MWAAFVGIKKRQKLQCRSLHDDLQLEYCELVATPASQSKHENCKNFTVNLVQVSATQMAEQARDSMDCTPAVVVPSNHGLFYDPERFELFTFKLIPAIGFLREVVRQVSDMEAQKLQRGALTDGHFFAYIGWVDREWWFITEDVANQCKFLQALGNMYSLDDKRKVEWEGSDDAAVKPFVVRMGNRDADPRIYFEMPKTMCERITQQPMPDWNFNSSNVVFVSRDKQFVCVMDYADRRHPIVEDGRPDEAGVLIYWRRSWRSAHGNFDHYCVFETDHAYVLCQNDHTNDGVHDKDIHLHITTFSKESGEVIQRTTFTYIVTTEKYTIGFCIVQHGRNLLVFSAQRHIPTRVFRTDRLSITVSNVPCPHVDGAIVVNPDGRVSQGPKFEAAQGKCVTMF